MPCTYGLVFKVIFFFIFFFYMIFLHDFLHDLKKKLLLTKLPTTSRCSCIGLSATATPLTPPPPQTPADKTHQKSPLQSL